MPSALILHCGDTKTIAQDVSTTSIATSLEKTATRPRVRDRHTKTKKSHSHMRSLTNMLQSHEVPYKGQEHAGPLWASRRIISRIVPFYKPFLSRPGRHELEFGFQGQSTFITFPSHLLL